MTKNFWNDQENNYKYHLSNIGSLTQRKEAWGLGIRDLRDINLCLLTSWVQRYHDEEANCGRRLLMLNTQLAPPICFVAMIGLVPFWKGVMWATTATKWEYK
jgi:hypothetical protein